MRPRRRNRKDQSHRATADTETDAPRPYEFHTLSRSKNRGTSVRTRLEDLRQQKGRLMAQQAEADASRQNARTRLKRVQAEIDEVSTDSPGLSEEQELFERESERTPAEDLRQELTELLAEQRIVERALGAIKRLKDKCSTCGQAISAGAKERETEKQSGRLAEIEGLVQGIRKQLSECSDLEVASSRGEDQPERPRSPRGAAG
jgi:DNA repair exonuclease SbcCD ATPase subunit